MNVTGELLWRFKSDCRRHFHAGSDLACCGIAIIVKIRAMQLSAVLGRGNIHIVQESPVFASIFDIPGYACERYVMIGI